MAEKIIYDSLAIDDAQYKTILTSKYKNKKPYRMPVVGEITAFIPGTIFEIFVKEGETVVKGQVLLILNAMKMMNRLEAPFNGVVKEVKVNQGDIVSKNQLLVIIT